MLKNKFSIITGYGESRKARLVARGFEQKAGLDYFDTFASGMRYATFGFMMAKVAEEDLEADHVDISTAFLNDDCKEELYMDTLPHMELAWPELKGRSNEFYCNIEGALYGPKQAPKEWFDMVVAFFNKLGMKQSDGDPNLFVGQGVNILLFVDDMLITGRRAQVDIIKKKILLRWKGADLKAVKTSVGFQVDRDRQRRTLKLHQSHYTDRMLSKLGMSNSTPLSLPLPAGTVMKEATEAEELEVE